MPPVTINTAQTETEMEMVTVAANPESLSPEDGNVGSPWVDGCAGSTKSQSQLMQTSLISM